MKAEIITIGTEITTGSTLNTHSQYLASKLLELGIETLYHTSVDDDIERLRQVILISLDRVDLVITTGGLGPTDDDLTKEVITELLGLDLIRDIVMEDKIKETFTSLGNDMPSNNLKQAKKPEGSEFLKNSIGTAPGIFLSKDDRKIIMLPGPPGEMKMMFDNEVMPLFHEESHISKRSVNLIGIGESLLEMEIKDLINTDDDINVATFAKDGEVEIKIIGKGRDLNNINNKIDKIIVELENRFKEFIYGLDNIPIEEIVFQMLKELNYKIGFCESCTGGLISGRFSRIAGVSEVFDRGLVTYSNNAKVEEVSVKSSTLDKYGAVSEETALEMAKGMLKNASLDIALSITGVAGPDGGSVEKPVGLVYMCVATKDKSKVIKCQFTGDREKIQNRAVIRAFAEIRKFLLNNN